MPTPTTTDETDPDELTRWMNTEGIRRLEAMKADPAQCLTHEEFWSVVDGRRALASDNRRRAV